MLIPLAGFFHSETVLPSSKVGGMWLFKEKVTDIFRTGFKLQNYPDPNTHQSIWASNQPGPEFMRTFPLQTRQEIFLLCYHVYALHI